MTAEQLKISTLFAVIMFLQSLIRKSLIQSKESVDYNLSIAPFNTKVIIHGTNAIFIILHILFIPGALLVFTEPTSYKINSLIFLGALSTFMRFVTVLLKSRLLSTSYEEYEDYMLISRGDLIKKVEYDEILEWSETSKDLIINDSTDKYYINKKQHKPIKLIQTLIEKQEKGQFKELSEYNGSQVEMLFRLNALLNQSKELRAIQ